MSITCNIKLTILIKLFYSKFLLTDVFKITITKLIIFFIMFTFKNYNLTISLKKLSITHYLITLISPELI